MIRKATYADLQQMLEVYSSAKEFMKNNGNPKQWKNSYPSQDLLKSDMDKGFLYVLEDEITKKIYGCFVLAEGEDPTYNYIEGKWNNNSPYATLHRVASNGSKNGVFSECVEFARRTYSHLRVDTHKDNLPMQKAILNNGFVYCGIIYIADGSPRLAYEWNEM